MTDPKKVQKAIERLLEHAKYREKNPYPNQDKFSSQLRTVCEAAQEWLNTYRPLHKFDVNSGVRDCTCGWKADDQQIVAAGGIKAAWTEHKKLRYSGGLPDKAIGMCLGCGRRLTLCGRPFTADIVCKMCFTINRFVNSQQPICPLEKSNTKAEVMPTELKGVNYLPEELDSIQAGSIKYAPEKHLESHEKE